MKLVIHDLAYKKHEAEINDEIKIELLADEKAQLQRSQEKEEVKLEKN